MSGQSGDGGDMPAGLDVVGLVRTARRQADTSQREMATKAGVAASTIGRIEAGSLVPSLGLLASILRVAGIRLVAVGPDGAAVPAMLDAPDGNLRDGAGRRYPSHLDTVVDPTAWEWWGGLYGLARPPETFLRNRERRDVQRRRSQWEVRMAQLRGVPPPPTVEQWRRQLEQQAQQQVWAMRVAAVVRARAGPDAAGGRSGRERAHEAGCATALARLFTRGRYVRTP